VTTVRIFRTLALLAAASAGVAPAAAAQQFRFRSTTTARFVQLRPMVFDTAVQQFIAGDVDAAVPLTEDLEASAWGFGVEGLRAYGLLRGRASIGSGLVWPRAGDHFDAMALYAELERPTYRVRLGRQQRASGLGIYGFDGGLGTWRPRPNLRLEGYAGGGLARGYSDPINSDAIRGIEPLLPDHGTLLFGASVWAAPNTRSVLSAIYQREILSDRSGVVSERAAFDAQTTLGGRLALTGAADYDFSTSAVGRARISGMLRLPRGANLRASVFRYAPVFDLTTIWGAFSPQPHHGGSVGAEVSPAGSWTVSGGWTRRIYEKVTETTPFLVNVGTTADAWTAGARWTNGALVAEGSYRYSTGYGGNESGGDLRLAWQSGERWSVAASGTAFQEAEYFRVARGTVFGVGADAHVEVHERLGLRGQLMQYFHTDTSGQRGPNWSQTRAMISVEWIFGASADRVAGYP
jgi:hypothetical protein